MGARMDRYIAEQFGSLEVQILRRAGAAFVELVRLAQEASVDLIVMATQGRSGISHLLMGSTTEKVVRKAPCPVLTVRRGEHLLRQGTVPGTKF